MNGPIKQFKVGSLDTLITCVTKFPEMIGHINAIHDFGVYHGVGLTTARQGAVLTKPFNKRVHKSLDKDIRYLVSVDEDNHWGEAKKTKWEYHSEEKEKEIITKKYGSIENYHQEIRKFLVEDFLDKFLPFLGEGPLVYTFQTSLNGAFPSNDAIVRNMFLWDHNVPSLAALRYMRGAHFYASPQEFTFKPEFNAWGAIPWIDLRIENDRLTHEIVSASDVKFHSNLMISFEKDPDGFDKFRKLLNEGPKGSSFAIGNDYFCYRFFTVNDPINDMMKDYFKSQGEKYFNPNKEGKRIIHNIKDNLKERGIYYTDPSLNQHSLDTILKFRECVEKKKKESGE